MTQHDTVTVYSDYVCPFCYLGRHALSRYQETRDEPLRIDWRPFDLRGGQRGPDGELDRRIADGKDEAYYERARQGVRRLQERYDVEMTLDVATDVDSLNAQLVSRYLQAERPYETWLAFDESVFEALWVEGRDIGSESVLVDVAEAVGVDAETARSALSGDAPRRALDEAFEASRRAGVSGVPTFFYDGHQARGAVPPAQLRRLVEGT
ncbi:DsbA family oxidoreductase [Haloarchaeobius sp. HRN-SO-5]|uniref:DsbA family oxidoreductase n=1 Tax=Haloarchaeobius sp. HRN-SO-5 TaxID=3446118 RepID=UPI003EBE190A